MPPACLGLMASAVGWPGLRTISRRAPVIPHEFLGQVDSGSPSRPWPPRTLAFPTAVPSLAGRYQVLSMGSSHPRGGQGWSTPILTCGGRNGLFYNIGSRRHGVPADAQLTGDLAPGQALGRHGNVYCCKLTFSWFIALVYGLCLTQRQTHLKVAGLHSKEWTDLAHG